MLSECRDPGQSDSSDYALGSTLYQRSDEGEREVVAHTSSTSKNGRLTYPYLKSKAERPTDKADKRVESISLAIFMNI
ncbi:hypothetical protein JTB14_019327 [Gonioctena quinquepunctata]|nr:hypothetical protein JTB14_019327 [Gonioctena quinquepunctata]